jgi:hypothetical protein
MVTETAKADAQLAIYGRKNEINKVIFNLTLTLNPTPNSNSITYPNLLTVRAIEKPIVMSTVQTFGRERTRSRFEKRTEGAIGRAHCGPI